MTTRASLASKTASLRSDGSRRTIKRPPPPTTSASADAGRRRVSIGRFSGASLIGAGGRNSTALGGSGSRSGGGAGSPGPPLTATLKVWKTSCPEASLTLTTTSTSARAKDLGTAQASLPSGVTFMPSGPLSSLALTPPFFDRTASG